MKNLVIEETSPFKTNKWWRRSLLTILICCIIFDIIWTFSLLNSRPFRNSRELTLIEISEITQENGAPAWMAAETDSFDYGEKGVQRVWMYPRSPLFVYLLSGWESLVGRNSMWLRALSAFFYYALAVLLFLYLGRDIFALGAAVTLLLSWAEYYQIICKPYTVNQFMFFLVFYFCRPLVLENDPAVLKKAAKFLFITLIVFALIYEGAFIAVAFVFCMGVLYKGLRFLANPRLWAATIAVMAIGVLESILFRKYFPLKDVSLISNSIWQSAWEYIHNGLYLKSLFSILTEYDQLQVVAPGVLFLILCFCVLVNLFHDYPKLRYTLIGFLVCVALCSIYFINSRDRLRISYVLHFLPVVIVLVWQTGQTLVGWLSSRVRWRRMTYAIAGLIVVFVLLVEVNIGLRQKPFNINTFTNYASSRENWAQSVKDGDVCLIRHPLGEQFSAYVNGRKLSIEIVSIPKPDPENTMVPDRPSEDRSTKTPKLLFTTNPSRDYYYRKVIHSSGKYQWPYYLKEALGERRRIWFVSDTPVSADILQRFAFEFQTELYDLQRLETIRNPYPGASSIKLPDRKYRWTVVTFEVESGAGKGMFVYGVAGGASPERRLIWLEPGHRKISLFFDHFPKAFRIETMPGDAGSVTIHQADIFTFRHFNYNVLESTIVGGWIVDALGSWLKPQWTQRQKEILIKKYTAKPHKLLPLIYRINTHHPFREPPSN